jgi:hypothetical protein
MTPTTGTEVVEGIHTATKYAQWVGLGKSLIDLGTCNDPSGVMMEMTKNLLDLGVDIGRLHPAFGFVFNFVSLGMNLYPAVEFRDIID